MQSHFVNHSILFFSGLILLLEFILKKRLFMFLLEIEVKEKVFQVVIFLGRDVGVCHRSNFLSNGGNREAVSPGKAIVDFSFFELRFGVSQKEELLVDNDLFEEALFNYSSSFSQAYSFSGIIMNKFVKRGF